LVRAGVQNVPGNIGEASPAGETHAELAQKVDQGSDGLFTSSTLPGPVLRVQPAELPEIAVDRELF